MSTQYMEKGKMLEHIIRSESYISDNLMYSIIPSVLLLWDVRHGRMTYFLCTFLQYVEGITLQKKNVLAFE